MSNYRIARRYAHALLDSAESVKQTEEVQADLDLVIAAMTVSREFTAVIKSPVIQSWRKKNVLRELFKDRISRVTMLFLDLLCNKRREALLPHVRRAYGTEFDRRNNRLRVTVTSAVPLGAGEQQKVTDTLTNRFGKTIIADFADDASLLGGLRITVLDTVIDGSVRNQLLKLRAVLSGNTN